MRAGAVVAEPRRELERPVPPDERLPGVLGEHRVLREAAVRARELGRLPERLEDLDRLERLRPRDVAVAGEPVEPREDARAAADPLYVAELPVDANRAVDRLERLIEAVHVVGRLGELLEHARALRELEPVGEVGGAAIVGVGLAVGVECGGAACGDERVVGDDVVEARVLRVVHDQRRVGALGDERLRDLHMEAAGCSSGQARGDRVARELVPEADVLRVDGEELPPLGLLRRLRPARQHGIEQPRRHAVRNDGHELDEAPRVRRRGARRARARRSSPTAAARSRCASRGAR